MYLFTCLLMFTLRKSGSKAFYSFIHLIFIFPGLFFFHSQFIFFPHFAVDINCVILLLFIGKWPNALVDLIILMNSWPCEFRIFISQPLKYADFW